MKETYPLKLIKKFAFWHDFSKYIGNSIFCKTLQAHQDKSEPNFTEKQKIAIVISFCFPYYKDKGFQLIKSCINKIAKLTKQLYLRSYMIFVTRLDEERCAIACTHLIMHQNPF